MVATTMSEEQCNNIFKPIRAGVLPKAGYCRTIPSKVLHGPEKYGGIGIRDLHTIQETEHIRALIDDGGTDTPTGKLLQIATEGHTLETGRGGQIFDMPYQRIEMILTTTWVKDTLKYLSDNRLQVQTSGPTMQKWREGDKYLMEALDSTPGVSVAREDIQAFNRCRIHMRVVTLSDICTASGDNILSAAWECRRGWESISSRQYEWPYQPRPGQADIQVWQRILQTVFDVGKRYLTISTNLGPYFHRTRRYTKWLYNRNDESLYRRDKDTWHRWRQARHRSRTLYYEATGETRSHLDRQWDMAVVTEPLGTDRVIYEGNARIGAASNARQQYEVTTDQGEEVHQETHPTGASLEAAIRKIPASLQWVVENTELPQDNGSAIAQSIIRDNGKCICDGSLKDTYGTSAAFAMGVQEDHSYSICNRIPGAPEDQSSYRSELCGILANIVVMNTIAKVHGIDEGTVMLGCDNESALWMAFGQTQVNTGDASFDIIKVIHHELATSPITWQYQHVRGHQDAVEAIVLDEWAQANVEADRLAGEYWTLRFQNPDIPRIRPTPSRMPGEGWRLTAMGRPLVQNIDTQIHEHTYYARMMTYWEDKGRLDVGQHERVAWPSYKGALNLMTRGKRQWVHKHHCGFEGNNYRMHQWKQRKSPNCPRCARIEKHRHILRCQSSKTEDVYRASEQNMASWLTVTTSPELKQAILTHL